MLNGRVDDAVMGVSWKKVKENLEECVYITNLEWKKKALRSP